MVSSSTLVDRVKIQVLSSGTGPFELGAAVPAYRGVEALVDGSVYSYATESGDRLYEVGTAVYDSGAGVLIRTPTLSSNGGAAVAFPSGIQVNFTALAADIVAASGNLPVVQTPGASTTSVMSQKAVTDALAPKANRSGTIFTGTSGISRAGNASWLFDIPVGSASFDQHLRNGVGRWAIGANTDAESGANAGTNFFIYRYDDAGNFIDQPLIINRMTGQLGLSARPIWAGATPWDDGNLIRVQIPGASTTSVMSQKAVTDLFATGQIAKTSFAGLPAVAPSVDRVVYLTDAFRAGFFVCKAGAPPVTDTQGGIFITSSTPSFYWERIRDTPFARPEWFGAQPNNGAFDCWPACKGALDVTGTLIFGPGVYYGSRGLVLPNNAYVRGAGALISQYSISHASDHIMSQRGVAGVSYALGADLADFALGRSVNPFIPPSESDDQDNSHGLDFYMVSNPRVQSVYTYNNLMELYLSNVLSPDLGDVRGIQLLGVGARWYGVVVDGTRGGGTFGGPSPNPSTTIRKPNMVGNAGITRCWNYLLTGNLQDLWMTDPEAASGDIQFFINSNGSTGGDFHIERPIADGYRQHGIYIKGLPPGSSLAIEQGWVAPAPTASAAGVRIESSHGVDITVRGDFLLAPSLRGFDVSDSSLLRCSGRFKNCENPFYSISLFDSEADIRGFKSTNGGAAGYVAQCVGGERNKVTVGASITGSSVFIAGFIVDATAVGYSADVTAVAAAAVGTRASIAGTPVTTQGNVSGHLFFNPGAGPLL